jgi:hypothetical protein
MERIIVHRPHPWGLLAALTELVRTPSYGLFAQPFVRATPEVERLFESVTRSCSGGVMPVHAQQQQAQQAQAQQAQGGHSGSAWARGGASADPSRSSTPASNVTGDPREL